MKTSKLINLFIVFSLTIVFLDIPTTTLAQGITGTISGSVTDEVTSQPLANVWVHLRSSGNGGCTDANGNYTITGLDFGSYQVEAQAGAPWCGNNTTLDYSSEWWPEAVSILNAESVTVTSGSPNATNINFTLGPGGTISGTVRDVDGNILPNVYVSADGIESPNPGQGACSDNQGKYTVSGLPRGYSFIVSAGYNYCGTPGLAVEYWQESANFANVMPIVISVSNAHTTGIDFTLQTTNETDIGSTYIFALLESNTINADYWPEGIPITLTIDDPATIPSVDYTSTATPSIDNPSTFGFIEGFTLAPRMIMKITNGDITKIHIITDLVVEGTDVVTDTVFGIAYPYSPVWIACGDERISRFVTADSTGHWNVNFGVPGPTDQEQDLCDLQPGVGGFAIEGGGDLQNDFTMDTWFVRFEEIDYFALGDSIASGHGLNDDGTACLRSDRSYPNLVIQRLEERYENVSSIIYACSGATARPNSLNESPYKSFTKQVDNVIGYIRTHPSDDPILVSITIGANDFGWATGELFTHLFLDKEPKFNNWVDNLVDNPQNGIKVLVKNQVKRLLRQQNVVVVLTDVYNPVNKASFLFSPFCTFTGSCYRRIDYLVHEKLNTALISLTDEIGQPQRLQIAFVEDSFHDRESPFAFCGLAGPSINTTYIQYPGNHEYNSFESLPLKIKLLFPQTLQGQGGDCFHPNDKGAAAYADAVNEAAILMGR